MADVVPPARRKRMRLHGYDYSLGGGYFITIDVLDRLPLFGHVEESTVQLTPLGCQVAEAWQTRESRYPGLLVDEWILMPDHLHGILVLTSIEPDPPLPSIVRVIEGFKSYTTRLYHEHKQQAGQLDLPARLWQRSYYDRILRSERDADEKREYIRTNPQRYELKRRGLL